MPAIEVFAPAKINLSLHVTGQRADGYHLLDSLVVFASVGDTILVQPAQTLSLQIEGPFGAGLAAEPDNLVLRAARLFDAPHGAAIRLIKRLPLSSGIGGGSADAAATLRALSALWRRPMPASGAILGLGADVPVCVASAPCRMRGIGEAITPLTGVPQMGLVLVNPGVAVPTHAVFSALARRDNPPMDAPVAAPHRDRRTWIAWLARQRNDLETAAIAQQPAIGCVLAALRALPGCRLARMSGSGATCFGLFDPGHAPDLAPLQAAHPHWWIASAEILPPPCDPVRATTAQPSSL